MLSARVVAVGGHESDDGRALPPLLRPGAIPVARGRELFRAVAESRSAGESVCVVPMTLGRDAELVADAARTLLALPAEHRSGTVLAAPFGTAEHLVGWLRAAATRVPTHHALLVTAPSGDPFDDAELYRIARLVRQYGHHRTVEVALSGGDPDPREGVRRCRALGAERVTLLPAAWAVPDAPDPECSETRGPLLSPSAIEGVLSSRVRDAWHRLHEHGDDGMSAGLTAAHGHSHSHDHDIDHGPAHGDVPRHQHEAGSGHHHDSGPSRGTRPRQSPDPHGPFHATS